MTDIQAIVGALTCMGATIAASIRWGTGRMARAQDRSVAAMVRNAESNATLAARFESLVAQIQTLASRFDRLVEVLVVGGSVSQVTAGALQTPEPAQGTDPAVPVAIAIGGARREESTRVAGKKIGKPRRGQTGRGDTGDP